MRLQQVKEKPIALVNAETEIKFLRRKMDLKDQTIRTLEITNTKAFFEKQQLVEDYEEQIRELKREIASLKLEFKDKCPNCGEDLLWVCDYDYDDLYPTEKHSEDWVASIWECPHCQCANVEKILK